MAWLSWLRHRIVERANIPGVTRPLCLRLGVSCPAGLCLTRLLQVHYKLVRFEACYWEVNPVFRAYGYLSLSPNDCSHMDDLHRVHVALFSDQQTNPERAGRRLSRRCHRRRSSERVWRATGFFAQPILELNERLCTASVGGVHWTNIPR